MKIEKINIYNITLPFKGEFSISQLKGFSTNLIIVESVAHGGEMMGYGEGLPIAFVTGETLEGTLENIRTLTRKESFPWERFLSC